MRASSLRPFLFTIALSLGASAQAADDGADLFEKRVRPALARNCFACHSASGGVAMGELQLDSAEAMAKGGKRGPAVVPGKPAESLLLRAVLHSDPALAMPPSGKLADADIAALTEWVAAGAVWPAEKAAGGESKTFWAFVPPVEPKLPQVQDKEWAQSPIDHFVLSALEAKGLHPAAPADKRTLIRRATFDLTGLPPTPEEIYAFLSDDSPEAFAKVVDRLLASPRYGERWGRHWLDVARYADSNGLDENLVYKNAFRYRDYVIAAFNKDKPYDLFVQEQLAGDLLPKAEDIETTFERWTATGFLSLGAKMLAEDDPVKMQMDIVDEQLDTTARTFMGLTMGCARCHDHKFDPIPQADYYAMAGIFKSSKTMENFNVVARWHEYVLAPKEDRDRLAEHEAKIEAKSKEISAVSNAENRRLVVAAWERTGDYLLAADDALRYRAIELKPKMGDGIVRDAVTFDRGNVEAVIEKGKTNVPKDAKGPFFAEYDVTVDAAGEYQLDFLDLEMGGGTADISVNGVLESYGEPPVTNRAASPDAGGWTVAGVYPLVAGRNTIRLEHKSRYPYFEALAVAKSELSENPKSVAQIARQYDVIPGFLEQWVERLERSQGAPASVLFAWHAFHDGQSLDGWSSPAAKAFGEQAADRAALAQRYQALFSEAARQWRELHPEEGLDYKGERYRDDSKDPALPDAGLEEFRKLLYEKFGPFRPPSDAKEHYAEQARAELARLNKERKALEEATPDYPRAMGVREGDEIADIPVHIRGSHWSLGEIVPRRFLTAIAGEDQPELSEQESGRLQLARWLTGRDHPLTSRVMANRLWRWHFGEGIVPSVDNFGHLGQLPTNQPLLDWLALRFVENGWSVKKMHRMMLLSSTYQMSSDFDAKAAEVDPENTLLWRFSRQRLDAEAMRDAIVSIADDLDVEMGGSIMDFKDRQYVANTAKRGGIDYDRNRRAVYLPVVRSSMYDVFSAFDFADPSTANGDRNATVVAPQALFMMNGTIVLSHTRMLAESLLADESRADGDRVREAYERVLGRLPTPEEIDRVQTFLSQVDRALAERVDDNAERRVQAWQSFCKSLIASNEFLYVN